MRHKADQDIQHELTSETIGISLRGEHLWLDDVHISSWECPDCLQSEDFDCHYCEFFSPSECRLLVNHLMRDDLRMVFSTFREFRVQQIAKWEKQAEMRMKLTRAIHSELQSHGRPLHFSVIAQMVSDRYTDLVASDWAVAQTMGSHPELFHRVWDGVYEALPSS